MSKFETVQFGPDQIVRPSNATAPVPPNDVRFQMVKAAREELLLPKSPLQMMALQIPGGEPVIAKFSPAGHTAMVVRWVSGSQLETASVTLLLSGIDAEEDEQAISDALAELSAREDTKDYIEELISQIANMPRPLMATIHLYESSYDSSDVRDWSMAMGSAFSDKFGL